MEMEEDDRGTYILNSKDLCLIDYVSELDKAGVVFTKLIAEENPDLARAYGIKQAPTLVVIENGEYVSYKGVSDIKKYIETVS
jgi:thioredoxin-like negative regulator of GroEL